MLWAIIMHCREREIKKQTQKGGSLNLFNDALYIAFLGLKVHHHAAVKDFIFIVLNTDMNDPIGLFWLFTMMLSVYRSHFLFLVSDNISCSSL